MKSVGVARHVTTVHPQRNNLNDGIFVNTYETKVKFFKSCYDVNCTAKIFVFYMRSLKIVPAVTKSSYAVQHEGLHVW